MAKFRVGETVRLLSGGPVMTVKLVEESVIMESDPQMYRCQWFSGTRLSEGHFAEQVLERADAKSAKDKKG